MERPFLLLHLIRKRFLQFFWDKNKRFQHNLYLFLATNGNISRGIFFLWKGRRETGVELFRAHKKSSV